MWCNDLPRGNSTWPHSGQIVARDLGGFPAALRAKLLRENVARFYDMRFQVWLRTGGTNSFSKAGRPASNGLECSSAPLEAVCASLEPFDSWAR